MSLDRDARLSPQNVLDYPVDGLEVFGPSPPPMLAGRAAWEFAAFYRQIGDDGRASQWERTVESERSQTPGIAAVVILYCPAEDVLDNVDSYRGQVDTVIAVDNTDAPDRRFVERLESRGVDYVSLGGNKGIAAALNEGCRRAREHDFDWVLTLDQDSTATPGMVARLSATVGSISPRRAMSRSSHRCGRRSAACRWRPAKAASKWMSPSRAAASPANPHSWSWAASVKTCSSTWSTTSTA